MGNIEARLKTTNGEAAKWIADRLGMNGVHKAAPVDTYTDARLLDTAEAVESLGIVRDTIPRTLAPLLAPNRGQTGQIESIPDHSSDFDKDTQETRKACKTLGFTGLLSVGARGFEPPASTSRT